MTRCWTLPYVRRGGAARELNRWMAATWADDALVIPGATVHPDDVVADVVDEALGPLGLAVVKLHCSVGEHAPDDPRLDPLWRRVSESGHPVVVHAGHAVAGTTTAADLAPLARVAARWPDARIVVAHCGAPAVDAALTPVVRTPVPLARADLAGLERRLLYGSDTPNVAVTIEESVAAVRALGLDPADEDAVLGGTALRLLART